MKKTMGDIGELMMYTSIAFGVPFLLSLYFFGAYLSKLDQNSIYVAKRAIKETIKYMSIIFLTGFSLKGLERLLKR